MRKTHSLISSHRGQEQTDGPSLPGAVANHTRDAKLEDPLGTGFVSVGDVRPGFARSETLFERSSEVVTEIELRPYNVGVR